MNHLTRRFARTAALLLVVVVTGFGANAASAGALAPTTSVTNLEPTVATMSATTPEEAPFTEVVGYATKTGFRGVVAFAASAPVTAVVEYGTSPTSLTTTASALPGAPDTAGLIVFDGLEVGSTIYYRLRDTQSGATTAIRSFKAANAYSDWDAGASTYTLDLLVQLDTDELPEGIEPGQSMREIAQGISIFAERLYDATDGFARIGNVVVTDTNLDYAANIPEPVYPVRFPVCPPEGTQPSNLADVVIQTAVAFDSHTYSGFQISSPCISFYVGRVGQLVVAPWEDEFHFGYVSTHEMMHYAFNAPDLYDLAAAAPDCRNTDLDISIMHNTGGWVGDHWELTELDRENGTAFCNMGTEVNSWDALRARYTQIPDRTTAQIVDDGDTKARGNPDGGALDIHILDRAPLASTLTQFTPNDNGLNQECRADGPVTTDVAGDTFLPASSSIDIRAGTVRFDPMANEGAGALSFIIEAEDVGPAPPPASTGEQWAFNFNVGGKSYFTAAMRTGVLAAFSLSEIEVDPVSGTNNQVEVLSEADGVTGSIDEATDLVTVTIPLAAFNAARDPDLGPGSPITGVVIEGSRIAGIPNLALIFAPDDESAGACPYVVGQELGSAPVAADDTVLVEENATAVVVDVLANDVDLDGNELSVSGASDPAHGTVTVASDGSAVRYTPDPGYVGDDSFTYTVTDRINGSDTATVAVTVFDVNHPPTAADDAATVSEDGLASIDVLANDTDADGDGLTVIAVTEASHGRVSIGSAGQSVAYAPHENYAGSDSFTYTVRDSSGVVATATVSITVLPVNDAPVAVDDRASAGKQKRISIDVLANDSDPDGDPIRVAAVTTSENGGTVEINPDGTVSYRSRAGFKGTDTFTYRVVDALGVEDIGTVIVNVG